MESLGATTDLLALLAEPSRVRLLALLAEHELTVNELTSITELGQSRVSTHLGRLREAGLVRDKRVGGSTFYSLANGEMPGQARKLWELVSGALDDEQLAADKQRCAAQLRARTVKGASRWPESVAGEMERHYSPGRTWQALAGGVIGLLELGDVLDAGAGDGATAQLLAPRARTITCVDVSDTLVEAARVRLAGLANARCRVADAHDLPFHDASFDQVLLLNVLPFLKHPGVALGEAARVLRPGGRLALVTLAEHEHMGVTSAYGHVHPGFSPAALRRLLGKAGLAIEACDVTSRERRAPYFQVVTAFAAKGPLTQPSPRGRGEGFHRTKQ
jgi:ArsR family transcriptional regulator